MWQVVRLVSNESASTVVVVAMCRGQPYQL